MKVLQFSWILFILVSYVLAIKGAVFHTVEISSFFPADVCSRPSIKGSDKGQSTMEVSHKHGPCSSHQGRKTAPSLREVLSQDQARVESIQNRITNKRKTIRSNLTSNSDKKVDLPAEYGGYLGSGNYIVTVGLGTPNRTLQLIFDTGSDLTWTQCQPCVRYCYEQQDPIFNPLSSASYKNVSCRSTECSQLLNATGNKPECNSNKCAYNIEYGDESTSGGFLSRDKLTISATHVFPNFIFGCGEKNEGLFGKTAGLIGLGRNALSLVSQTASTYKKIFSYCLPSSSSQTGYLTLGKNGASTRAKFTPLDAKLGTDFYFINIISISVGGKKLNIGESVFKKSVGIIDSGTIVTRLPPAAYTALRAAFREGMTKYKRAEAYSILDTCYDLSGYRNLSIPTVSFIFGGNVEIDLKSINVLAAVSKRQFCLAFAVNELDNDTVIYGNIQQKKFEVIYDVGKGQVGFAPDGCK